MPTARRSLQGTRGASLVEYLMLVGLVAIPAMAGVRWLGQRVEAKARAQAACIESFDCAAAAGPRADDPASGKREALVAALLAAQRADGLPADRAAAEAIADALLAGDTSDAARARIAAYFGPLGVNGSQAAMQGIRDAGLLDTFLDTTLRDAQGKPVDARVRAAVEQMMETGRLDVYAETLATTPVTVYDPKDPTFAYANGNHHFTGGNGGSVPRGVYFNQEALANTFGAAAPGTPEYDAAVSSLSATMAHEVFHAYNDAHGGPNGAVNEGMGIAAIQYAYTDGEYDIAEMIYGTKNFYRDKLGDPKYPLTAGTGDAELTAFLAQLASRDSSDVAYGDQATLDAEYQAYWAGLDRNDPNWAALAEKATRDMLAAREARKPKP
ncbi:MAG: hypothetical protein WKG00_16455 [Polyangiaceae bacterium]